MEQQGKNRRRQRLLAAALELSLQRGFRGTSMEAVARRAQVAKPTLYKYFGDKETLFLAVIQDLIGAARDLCGAELQREGPVSRRIGYALSAKHKMFFRLVENSPFAAELYMEKGRLAAPQIAAFERWLEDEVVTLLTGGDRAAFGGEGAGQGSPAARRQAQLVMACAEGIARKAGRVEQIGPAIREVCDKILA